MLSGRPVFVPFAWQWAESFTFVGSRAQVRTVRPYLAPAPVILSPSPLPASEAPCVRADVLDVLGRILGD